MLADVMLGKEEASEVAAVQQIKQLGTVERNFYVRAPKARKHGWRAGDCRAMRKLRHGSIRLSKPAAERLSCSQRGGQKVRRLSGAAGWQWDKPGGALA